MVSVCIFGGFWVFLGGGEQKGGGGFGFPEGAGMGGFGDLGFLCWGGWGGDGVRVGEVSKRFDIYEEGFGVGPPVIVPSFEVTDTGEDRSSKVPCGGCI